VTPASPPAPVTVFLRHGSPAGGRDRSLILEGATQLTGCPATSLLVGSLCPHCGSSDHGAPILAYRSTRTDDAPRAPLPRVSLSRTGDLVAVALSDSGMLGIDVESISRLRDDAIDLVAFHAHERDQLRHLKPAEQALRRTILWTAKEALLKAAGQGLVISPDLLNCEVADSHVELVSWPKELIFLEKPAVTISRVTPQHVCAVAHPRGAALTFSWLPIAGTLSS
jgi:4'-phosphopantetheinyl transferase